MIHDLGLHTDEEGGDGGKGVTMVGWSSRAFVRLDFAGEGIVGTTGVGASGKDSTPSRTPA